MSWLMTLAPLSNNSLNRMGEPSVIVVGSVPNNVSYELSRSACRLVYAMGAMMPIVLVKGGVGDVSPCESINIPDDTVLRASNAFVVFDCIPTDAGCCPAIADGVIQCRKLPRPTNNHRRQCLPALTATTGKKVMWRGGKAWKSLPPEQQWSRPLGAFS